MRTGERPDHSATHLVAPHAESGSLQIPAGEVTKKRIKPNMKASLFTSAVIGAALIGINSAIGAGHGGHGGGGGGGHITGPSIRGPSFDAPSSRVYTPSTPRFNGSAVQHYLGRPHGTFPRANVERSALTTTAPGRNAVTHPQTDQHVSKWSHSNQTGKSSLDRQTRMKLRNWTGKRDNSAQSTAEHREHKHHHHDRDWWRHHCAAIVFFDWGYWGWEDGWWFPAWGYDPYYDYYEYDGPIYGYDGLPPDQVVANVQGALQRLGYYRDAIDGILGPATQQAIERYQRDHNLPITGGIDRRTLALLGFIE